MTNFLTAVTGATGFVGSNLCEELRNRMLPVRALVRNKVTSRNDEVITGSIGPDTDWSPLLSDVETVIHCAAYVHQLRDSYSNQLFQCNLVNRDGTVHLAESAARLGVRRLIFLSTIKVNGENTPINNPFTNASPPNPMDPYGQSKWEAEQLLRDVSCRTGLEIVIVRPPLVYGPAVKANFLRLLQLTYSGLPLPFAGIDNRRSMVSLDNLLDLLIECIVKKEAVGQTFLVSDGIDFSTPSLIRGLAASMAKPARLFWFPRSLLSATGHLMGKPALVDRLIGSLEIDITQTRTILDWKPPHTVSRGLDKVTGWFLAQKSSA